MSIVWASNQKNGRETYEGRVLNVTRDTSYRVMSDVWGSADFALVWLDAEQRPTNVLVEVYDYGLGPFSTAAVDATPEVVEAYRLYLVEQKFQDYKNRAIEDANEIIRGATVEVVRGKTSKGTIGKVVVSIERTYNRGWKSTLEEKICIATTDVKVPVVAKNGKTYDNYRDVVWVWKFNTKRLDIASIDETALRQSAERVIAEQLKLVA